MKDKAKEGFSKLKDNFKKLKEGSEKSNGAKQATENLSKAKDFNTAGLGDKVKNGGNKVKHTKESAATNANDSIRRTRMKETPCSPRIPFMPRNVPKGPGKTLARLSTSLKP